MKSHCTSYSSCL